MHIVHVHIHIRPEHCAAFIAATQDNVRNSSLEPGIARFELIQQADDADRFTLVEHYRTPADQAAHRDTAHYLRWRAAVAPLMAEPRSAVKYIEIDSHAL